MENIMEMDIDNTLARFNVAKKAVATLVKEAQIYLKSDVPIDKRWAIYLKIEEFLPCDTCYFDLTPAQVDMNCGELTYYDDLGMDRHAVSTLSNMLNTLQEKVLEDSQDYKDAVNTYCNSHNIKYLFQGGDEAKAWGVEAAAKYGCLFTNFKEAIMVSGYGSTENDW